jgi:hypothetical protein
MKKILIIFVFMQIALVSGATSDFKLSLNKQTFSFGDEFKANVSIYNPYNYNINLEITAMVGSQDENFIPRPLMLQITVPKRQTKEVELYSFKIDEAFKNGDYEVSVKGNYQGFEFGRDSSSFRVFDALNELNLNVFVCKDASCSQESKAFVLGEDIYLNYDTNVGNISLKATLVYPDKTSKKINLPYSIKAGQVGTYYLGVSASKKGYRNVSLREMFGVIEKPAEISMTENAKKDAEALAAKQPKVEAYNEQDGKKEPNKAYLYFIISLFVVIAIIIVFLVIVLLKEKTFLKGAIQKGKR